METKGLFLILLLYGFLLSCSSGNTNVGEEMSVNNTSITVMGASSSTLKITSNTDWFITTPSSNWLTVNPMLGSGNSSISCTVVLPNDYRELRETYMNVKSKDNSISYKVTIKDSLNNLSPKPVIVADYPADNQNNVADCNLRFKWEPAIDSDGDRVYYNLEYSTDASNWTILAKKLWSPLYDSDVKVLSNTKYYWRVQAVDIFGAMSAYSKVFTFATGSNQADWTDGEVRLFQNCVNTTATDPATLIIVGDGFTADDLKAGGDWDKWSLKAVEALLSDIEPYRTWGQYLRIFRVGALSQERGASKLSTEDTSSTCSEIKNTKFGAVYYPQSTLCGLPRGYVNPSTSGSMEKLLTFIWNSLQNSGYNITKNYAILVIMNESVYNGTDYFYTSANGTVGFVTVTNGLTGSQTGFEDVVCHEIGGHGIGHFDDLYTGTVGKIPSEGIARIQSYHSINWFNNVSTSNNFAASPWNFFQNNRSDYDNYYNIVGAYEGAEYYTSGVWRPEMSPTCMNDNRLYYDAPSRYFIVKELKELAGEKLTWDEFVNKDYDRQNAVVTRNFVPVKGAKPLHTPIRCN